MLLTICETRDAPEHFMEDWDRLVDHVQVEGSDLVLLPEMPFAPWFAVTDRFDAALWNDVVARHEEWLDRLEALSPAAVIATRPTVRNGRRVNEAFVWEPSTGLRPIHVKYFLPNEPGFHETAWYERGDGRFDPAPVRGLSFGVLICTEMWSLSHAQQYGRAGAHLIAIPRATSRNSVEKWRTGGRVAAIVSGAYTASSNRVAPAGGPDLGGGGWVASPDGEIVAVTSAAQPFVTVDIDPAAAERAKSTYPRYALP